MMVMKIYAFFLIRDVLVIFGIEMNEKVGWRGVSVHLGIDRFVGDIVQANLHSKNTNEESQIQIPCFHDKSTIA
jgi:hypothetical protein